MGLRDFFRKYKKGNDTAHCANIDEKPNVKHQQQQQQKTNKFGIESIAPESLAPDNISLKYREFPFSTRRDLITDDYEISETSLGSGINGKVLTCWHRETRRKCALKIIKDSDRARREVILHKKASDTCAHIVQILDIYENTSKSVRCLLVVMECMEGGELFNRILSRRDRRYTEREAAGIILMIAKAVTHLHHMDIAHRDLKPENLLFTSTADDALLKLTDFGFAKEGNNEQLPLKTPCYTPYYVAPEILSNDKYDKACDIWSMGVIMYILLCGYPPFYSIHGGAISAGMKSKIKAGEYRFPKAEWNNVSQEAKSIITKMLTVDPAERVTIDWILRCSWFTGIAPDTPIDITPMFDSENYEQMRIESELYSISFNCFSYYSALVAAANHAQRRADADEDENINHITPGKSRVAQRVARRHQQGTTGSVPSQLSHVQE